MKEKPKFLIKNIEELIPYENNPRNNDAAVPRVAESIKEFGFKVPIIIDKDNVIIAGHTRLKASKMLGLKEVPCILADDLTDEQAKAFRLADNKVAELSEWNFEKMEIELEGLDEIYIDGFDFGFYDGFITDGEDDITDNEDADAEEYLDFIKKFEQKKTTDDCYTPPSVYAAIKDFVVDRYKITEKIKRPFYPGGDYKKEDYAGCVVIDNPPFSILSEIVRFYVDKGVKFFIFAPRASMFSTNKRKGCTMICSGCSITYENGARVPTDFITNMEGADVLALALPELYNMVKKADDENQKQYKVARKKLEYPNNVLTAAMLEKLSKYGQSLRIMREDAVVISKLDAQEGEDAIFGGGLLISEKAAAEKAAAEKAAAEKAAAEKAAAEKYELSQREKEIVKNLG